MDYLEKNISVMKNIEFKLYEELIKILDDKEYNYDNVREIDTKDGNKALEIQKDGNNYRFNSIYRPLNEAQRWTSQYEFQNLDISVIMFGMGNCLFVREMLKKLKNDAKVFLYEPDISIFLYVINNIDISDILIDKRINLFVNNINYKQFLDCLQNNIEWKTLSTQIVCHHPVYDKVYLEDYLQFLKTIHEENNLAIVNLNTEKHMSVTIADNAIKNLRYIKESNYVSEFIGKIPEDVPAIIVAAGPSLDKNIDELKNAEGKAFILATDTSVKYLLKHNINFDAMITLDAKKAKGHLQNEKCHNVPMFCVLEASNKFMQMHTGRKIWFRGSVYMYDLYNQFNCYFPAYNSGGSVATAAFSVCVSMNFKNIVLIGQDLAYSGNVTHAGGVVKNIRGEKTGREFVESVDGGKVLTRYDWIIYLKWFEDSITEVKKINVNVIDATEGGALIHGSKIMQLSEVIDEYCKRNFSFNELLKNMPYTFTNSRYDEVRNKMLCLKKEFDESRKKAKEGIKAANELIKIVNNGNKNTKSKHNNLKKVNKINKFIESQSAYGILDIYITKAIANDIQNISSLTEDEDENMKKTLEISVSMYEAIIEAVDTLMPTLEETMNNI